MGWGQPEEHICSMYKFLSTNLRLSSNSKLLVAYVTSRHANNSEVRFGVFFCSQRWDLYITRVQVANMGNVKTSCLRSRYPGGSAGDVSSSLQLTAS